MRTKYLKGVLLILAWLLICFFGGSRAEADTVVVHVISKHVQVSDRDYDFNEINYGIGYGFNISDNLRAIAGAYHNSMRKTSAYGGVELFKRYNNPFVTEAGVDFGVVSGYALDIPVGGAAYVRVADYMKVNVIPLIVRSKHKGVYCDGFVLGFSAAFGR